MWDGVSLKFNIKKLEQPQVNSKNQRGYSRPLSDFAGQYLQGKPLKGLKGTISPD
jgi:hypothetical protein